MIKWVTSWKIWFAVFFILLVFFGHTVMHGNWLFFIPVTFFMCVSGFLSVMFYLIENE